MNNKDTSAYLNSRIEEFKKRINRLETASTNVGETNQSIVTSIEEVLKFIRPLIVITLSTLLLMTVFEEFKELIFPGISKWQSHLITISFAATIAPMVAFFALRRVDKLRRFALKEIEARKVSEDYLQKAQCELEERVNQRTIELIDANNKLRQEILVRKDIERALREQESRYRLLFRSSPVGFFHFNTDMLVTEFNDRFLEIFDTRPEKVQNLNLGKLKDKSLLPAIKGALNDQKGFYEGLYHATTSDAVCYISLKTAPYHSGDGRILGGIGIVENINERKLAEKALTEAKENAEKSDSLKSEFLAQMSHEIRTPLNSMLSFVNLLQDELFDTVNEELRPGFDIISKSGSRIIRTIDLILNMAQVQSKTYEYSATKIDLYRDVLIHLYAELRPVADKKNIELKIVNLAGNTEINADVYIINQIFYHLIDNAVKFTEKGYVKILLTEDSQNRLNVSVRDSGVGMTKEYMSKLFKPFSQEEQGYTRRYEGLGLGLALVNKYCQILGARIVVNSLKSIGSTFTVVFPDLATNSKLENLISQEPLQGSRSQVQLNISDSSFLPPSQI